MSSLVPGIWSFTDHCCRDCLCRIMSRLDGPVERQLHRCSGCGAEAAGEVEALCACGAHYRDHPKVGAKRGLLFGFRCIINPRRDPVDFPAEVVAKQIRLDDETLKPLPRQHGLLLRTMKPF